jgi:hypothetical protein
VTRLFTTEKGWDRLERESQRIMGIGAGDFLRDLTAGKFDRCLRRRRIQVSHLTEIAKDARDHPEYRLATIPMIH